jgi:nucleoside-diphosphate-sugar epimerase
MKKKTKILVIGACGQIGTELTAALRLKFGDEQVIAADRLMKAPANYCNGPYTQLDVLNSGALAHLVREEEITQIYLLAAMLSASGEQNIQEAWDLNMNGLINVLKIAAAQQLDKVFWPSSIAVFGPGSPKHLCPQETHMEPNTIYGISKRAGEYWCNYYYEKHGVDVRSLRYPGLISWTSPPGGGTTDYAVDIFHQALQKGSYTCYLKVATCLPMMYMPDAVRATLELMDAPKEQIGIRTAYNLSALSFSPRDLAAVIQRHIPGFQMNYRHDYRQAIADSWPASINDLPAHRDWGWQPQYDLGMMVSDMLGNLKRTNLQKLRIPEDSYVFTQIEVL